jgi:copper transport protein
VRTRTLPSNTEAHRPCRTWRGAALAPLAGAFILLTLLAAPAAAHPYLVTTLPQAGYSVPDSPPEIGLVFDEAVSFNSQAISVDGQARGLIPTSAPAASRQDHKVTVTSQESLPPGRYTVRWQVVGEDGHPVSGSFSFGVGTAPLGLDAQSVQNAPGVVASSLFRWLLLAGLSIAGGGLVGDLLVRSRIARSASPAVMPRPAVWLRSASGLGLLGAAGLIVQQAGAGDLAAGFNLQRVGEVWGTGPGRMLLLEALAFLTVLASHWRVLSGAALLLVVGAEAGHTHLFVELGALGWALMTLHLFAAAVWVGGLVQVSRAAVSWRALSGESRALFASYSVLALVLYVGVVTSGTLAAILIVPSMGALLDSSYGLVLWGKLALVLAASALALLGRRRLGQGKGFADGLHKTVSAERFALVGTLAVTAVLVSMPSPRSPTEELAYPPPIRGDVVRLGTLAGQVNVGVAAAESHLEIHLEIPEKDPVDAPVYALQGTLSNARTTDQDPVDLTSCGNGCFYAEPSWTRGDNELTLSVDAEGWNGGRAEFDIPWPMQSRQELLTKALKKMERTEKVVLREAVTSDTTGPFFGGEPDPMSGDRLLRAQPYKSGKVGSVIELGRERGATWIGFGLPSQQVFVRMLVRPDGRIMREEITTPRHLIRHRFTYPTPSAKGDEGRS